MRIARIRVHNFRSIRHIDLTTTSLMVFLGPNNHGKSNILRAIEFFLSPSYKLTKDEFFAYRPDHDRDLWVEMTFVELTAQERTTFSKYVQSNGTITIRKTARLNELSEVEVIYQGEIEEPEL